MAKTVSLDQSLGWSVCGCKFQCHRHSRRSLRLVKCSFARSVTWMVCVWLQIPVPSSFASVTKIPHLPISRRLMWVLRRKVWSMLSFWSHFGQFESAETKEYSTGKNTSTLTILGTVKETLFCWMSKRSNVSGLSMENWSRFSGLGFV